MFVFTVSSSAGVANWPRRKACEVRLRGEFDDREMKVLNHSLKSPLTSVEVDAEKASHDRMFIVKGITGVHMLTTDSETIPLGRNIRRVEDQLFNKNLKELEERHGMDSIEVAMLLKELVKRLELQAGNETFVESLNERINRIQQKLLRLH